MSMPVRENYWRFDSELVSDGWRVVPNLMGGDRLLSGGSLSPGLRWDGHRFTAYGYAEPEFYQHGTANWGYTDWVIRVIFSSGPINAVRSETLVAKNTPGWINCFKFYMDTDDELKFYVLERAGAASYTLTSGFKLSDGFVHDCAVRKVGSDLELIVDGQVVDTAVMTDAAIADDANFVVGNVWGTGYGFTGTIEAVETWTTSLGGSIPTTADLIADQYVQTNMALEPVDPYRGQAEISPTADTSLDLWILDDTNTVVQVSVDVNFLIPGAEKIVVRDGVAEPDFAVSYTNTPGVGLLVQISWDPGDYRLPWNERVPVHVFAENDGGEYLIAYYDFYTPTDNVAPAFQGQVPAPYTQRVSTSTGLYFELVDEIAGIDESMLVIEVDKHGNRQFETVYSGGSFQGAYTGTVAADGVEGVRKYNVSVDTMTLDPNSPIYLRVNVRDFAGNIADIRYWFRTVEVADDISPVYPVDQERLVSTGEGLVINFKFEDPLTVTVDGALAYDDALVPKFRNGWSGSFIDDVAGKRLVMAPPSAFSFGTAVEVEVTTASYSKTYTFLVTAEQITTTGDVTRPKITEATSANIWIGYIRGGNLVLRKGDPLTAETTVIPASQWDHGYDPTLGKYVLYWIDNSRVFYSTADPGDAPEILPQPSVVNASVSANFVGVDGVQVLEKFVSGSLPIPIFKTKPPTATLAIYRPTSDPNADKLVGFNLYSWWHGTANFLFYIPSQPGDPFDYSMPSSLHDSSSVFFLRPVYDRSGVLIEGNPSPFFTYPEFAEQITAAFAGSEDVLVIGGTTYPPLKFFVPEDLVAGFVGGEEFGTFAIFSYENSKAVSELDPDNVTAGFVGNETFTTVLVGGFGIIGVG